MASQTGRALRTHASTLGLRTFLAGDSSYRWRGGGGQLAGGGGFNVLPCSGRGSFQSLVRSIMMA
jgi:hypothetical protein